jgi:hypothetical protein
VLGKLLGGKLSNLGAVSLSAKWLAFAAIGLQIAAFPSDVLPWSTPTGAAKVLWLASYVLLVSFLVVNRALPGVLLVAAGVACNLCAILANGGLMPVLRSALAASGGSYEVHNNSIQLGHPHLAFLVDRWAAPSWVPLANVYSVGDVLIGTGVLLTVILAMRNDPAYGELCSSEPGHVSVRT